MKRVAGAITETLEEWLGDKAMQHSAALSFYALLALAPLLLFGVGLAGYIYGDGVARDVLLTQVDDKAGPQVSDAVGTVLTNARRPGSSIAAFVAGSILLLFGASGAVSAMRTALDAMWDVQETQTKSVPVQILGFLLQGLKNMALMLVFGLVLLVLLVITAAWGWVASWIGASWPAAGITLRAADFLVTLGVLTVLFAALFRFVPSIRPAWADLWLGAFVTALLFNAGRFVVGLYLARITWTSSFGAAGSVVALLLWVYYSAMIVFFGAESVKVYVRRCGRSLGGSPDAGEALPSAPTRSTRNAFPCKPEAHRKRLGPRNGS